MSLTHFDLNIRPEFLEAWQVRHAVRELLANAFDEHALCGIEEPPELVRSEGGWLLRDRGRGIQAEHLAQGESQEKLNDLRVIGKFGVGLKDALATLHRHGVQTRIVTPVLEVTVAERAKPGVTGLETLHAVLREGPTGVVGGTEVHLRGVPDSEVEAAKQEFLYFRRLEVLASMPAGEVLAKPLVGPAPIFIRGMRVADEPGFAFSYNIRQLTPAMKRSLNRERTNVGRRAYEATVQRLLVEAREPAVTSRLAREIERLASSGGADELRWTDVAVRACVCLSGRQRVVFGAQREVARELALVSHAKREGFEAVPLPAKVARELESAIDDEGEPVWTLARFREHWEASMLFSFVAPDELEEHERQVFSRADEVAGLVGLSLPGHVELRISETIRPEASPHADPVGLWVPGLRLIVIKRSQLGRFEAFAGTLLHELVHAVIGRGDVDTDFEIGLTEALGQVAATACAVEVRGRPLAWPKRRSTVAPARGGIQQKLFG